ncbi:hypothetical protein V8E52_005758 [Russula decolorans]
MLGSHKDSCTPGRACCRRRVSVELIFIKVLLWARLGETSHLYGPMIKFLEGDLGWVVILAIVELIFYIHGEGEWRVARASASLEEQTWTRT